MTDETDITVEAEEASSEQLEGACTSIQRVVAFYLADQRYAMPIERVQEIQQIVAFSEVPGGGGGVVGMVNLRGNVIPAVDLRRIVGLPPQEYTLETPMIICRISGQFIAIVVDEVQDVIELPEGCLQDPPSIHALASKMLGVARMMDGLIYVLDLDALLGSTLGGGW